jgi:methionine synthase II (cobalamin-independent)
LQEVLMAYGFDRFLTTHTGSLPRLDDLIRMMFAKEEGVPVDRAALAAQISEAVAEVIRKQVEACVDLVNDGEMSKPSYATYVKDRLTGFGGTSNIFVFRTWPNSRTLPNGCSATRAGRAAGRRPAPDRSEWATRPRRSRTSTT